MSPSGSAVLMKYEWLSSGMCILWRLLQCQYLECGASATMHSSVDSSGSSYVQSTLPRSGFACTFGLPVSSRRCSVDQELSAMECWWTSMVMSAPTSAARIPTSRSTFAVCTKSSAVASALDPWEDGSPLGPVSSVASRGGVPSAVLTTPAPIQPATSTAFSSRLRFSAATLGCVSPPPARIATQGVPASESTDWNSFAVSLVASNPPNASNPSSMPSKPMSLTLPRYSVRVFGSSGMFHAAPAMNG